MYFIPTHTYACRPMLSFWYWQQQQVQVVIKGLDPQNEFLFITTHVARPHQDPHCRYWVLYLLNTYMYSHYSTCRLTTVWSGFTCLMSPLKKYTDVDFPSGLTIFLVPLGNRITRLPSSWLDSFYKERKYVHVHVHVHVHLEMNAL
jgi:hypothetical protein